MRPARHRLTYLNSRYSIAEAPPAFIGEPARPVVGWPPTTTDDFSRPFYWTTWVLTWCLPPIVLARGLRRKDRFVIAVGAIVAVLTLATNKPDLGWQRHTWDPMLLGALLIGVALFIRRWLAAGHAKFATALPPATSRERTNPG